MHINNQARSPASNRPVSGSTVDAALADQTSTAPPDQQSTAGVPGAGKIVAVQQTDLAGAAVMIAPVSAEIPCKQGILQ